eukprot:GILJ01003779.1.p1 GENE.GILJ01003779.1~~GILJ01003779.1.p1  ORF type:complete len:1161 (+),score=247.88 GILJ01003779.1:139-3621(+)
MSSNSTAIVPYDGTGGGVSSYYSDSYDVSSSKNKRPETGFVGLSNQGATCYMNSLLQTLYMSPEFRQGLYKWRYNEAEHGAACDSIPLQLQLLFARLQLSKRPYVETRDLTKSFQWTSHDSFQQHDVQEFCRVLFDAIETTFKGTEQANFINDLYEGIMIDYVQCRECHHESSREDKFLDISLTVRNEFDKIYNDSVDKALENYLKPEILEGNNKYFCEKCNKKVDAVKGLKFKKFPPFLTLQLKRFDIDYNTMQRKKLNDEVRFPLILNMNQYVAGSGQLARKLSQKRVEMGGVGSPLMSPGTLADSIEEELDLNEEDGLSKTNNSQSSTVNGSNGSNGVERPYKKIDVEAEKEKVLEAGPYAYELFSILIHSGSALGGHYYAYIKSFENGRWYNFNDSSVSEISEEDIEKVFGGVQKKKETPYSSYKSTGTSTARVGLDLDDDEDDEYLKRKSTSTSTTTSTGTTSTSTGTSTYTSTGTGTYPSYSSISNRTGYSSSSYMSSFQSSTNAYLLMYRRVESEKIVNKVQDSEVPDYIQNELLEEENRYNKELQEYEERRQQITVKIYYKGKDKSVFPKLSDTLEELKKRAIKEFDLSDISLDNIRLRNYIPFQDIPAETYTGREQMPLEKLKFSSHKSLLLEVKQDGETFQDWNPDEMMLRLAVLDRDTRTLRDPIRVAVSKTGDIVGLQTAIEEVTGVPAARQRIVKKNPTYNTYSTEVLKVGKRLADYRLFEGMLLYMEEVDDPEADSLLEAEFAREHTLITIKFNDPADEKENEKEKDDKDDLIYTGSTSTVYGHSLQLEKTKTVMDLKTLIAQEIGLSIDQFLLKRGGVHMPEIKDVHLTLTQAGLYKGSQIYIEKGTPSRPGETRLMLYLCLGASTSDEEFFNFELLDEFSAHPDSLVSDVKKAIVAFFQEKKGRTLQNFRLREKSADKLMRVFYDSLPLKQHSLYEKKTLAIQEIPEDAPDIGPNDMLLVILKWSPSTWEMTAREEFLISRQSTMEECGKALAEHFNIPEENVELGKPQMYQRLNMLDFLRLLWIPTQKDDRSLVGAPFYLADGYLLVARDKTEQIRELTEEERKKMAPSGSSTSYYSSSSYTYSGGKTTYSRPKEKALQIHVKRNNEGKKDEDGVVTKEQDASDETPTSTGVAEGTMGDLWDL